MDESRFGTSDARGTWTPAKPISYGPAFDWPPKPKVLFKLFFGLPGYLMPWNVFYAIAALLIWRYLAPSLDTMKSLAASWIAIILVRNLVLTILVSGAWHMWFYVWRKQGAEFKYNKQWPKKKASGFLMVGWN